MDLITKEELNQVKIDADKTSIRQDVKAHCAKIRDGINKNGSTSGNRAIWELFQNADDFAKNGSTEIQITLTNETFVFAHKGIPFTHGSLSSLVKQESSQEKENDDTVGRFGTGFLTTHKFSRKTTVNGSMRITENPEVFVDVNDFEIDRTHFDEIDRFIDDMADQICAVKALFDGEQKTTAREWTSLTYELNDERKIIAQKAIDEAMKLMPYVLTFNDKLTSCTIDDKTRNQIITYNKVDKTTSVSGLLCKSIMISRNGETPSPFDCYYLEMHDGNSRIILPLESETHVRSLAGIPKLFVHFPLIPQNGQDYFGVNFLFHSHLFSPEEPRDNIIVPKDNDATEKSATANKKVLDEMTAELWNFLETNIHTWTNTIEMASIDIRCSGFNDSITESYYKKLKDDWTTEFSKLKIMDIDGIKYSMREENHPVVLEPELCSFLSNDQENDYLSVIYPFAKGAAKIPNKEELLKWSWIVAGWNSGAKENFISLESIADYVSNNNNGQLHKMLTLIVDAGHSEYFERFTLLPNREGKLMTCSQLRNAAPVTKDLYTLVKALNPAICTKMVDEEYADIIKLSDYGRKDLRDELNSTIKEKEVECWKNANKPYDGEFERNLMALCSCYNTLNGESKRKKLMPVICKFEGVEYKEREIPAWEDESESFDLYRSIFLSLVENQMMKIAQKDSQWVSDNYDDLVTFVGNATGDDYKSFCTRYAIYPDMNKDLHEPDSLKKCVDVDNILFDLYNQVMKDDLKSKCVDPTFATFFDKYNENTYQYTSTDVASDIKKKLSEGQYKDTIVLDIIDLTESDTSEGLKWRDLFKDIYEQRQAIRYNLGTPEEHQAVNTLLKQNNPELLKILAEVSENDDAMLILNKGMDAIEKMKDDEYKSKLGSYVEDHIQRFLEDALKEFGVSVTNDQSGQDLILSKEGHKDYRIEIKSRWNNAQSVEMTPCQFDCAVDYADRYALVSVNMSLFDKTKVDNKESVDLSVLSPNIKCLDNIGDLEKDLHTRTVEALRGNSNDIRLNASYKVVVPQRIFDNYPLNFNDLIEKIKSKFI